MVGPYSIVGWQERVRFPEWRVRMKAKVDTGARSSAIHAEEYELISETEIRLKLRAGTSKKVKLAWVSAQFVGYRNIKNSGGKTERRPLIKTQIEVAGETHEITLSVTNREQMRCPVLLGRAFTAGKFLVDSAAKNLTRKKAHT